MNGVRHPAKILWCAIAAVVLSCEGDASDAGRIVDGFISEARALYPTEGWTEYTNSLVCLDRYRLPKGVRGDLPHPGGTVRWIDVEGTCNFRDIGGWTGLRTGMAYRGAEVDCHTNNLPAGKKCHNLFATKKGLATLTDELGIRTDLDLRREDECPTPQASPIPGAHLVRIPVRPYTNFLKQVEMNARILRVFADKDSYPVYFHCYGGADRTGSVAFLLEGLCGVKECDLAIDFELTSFAPASIGMRPRKDMYVWAYASMLKEMRKRPGATLQDKLEHYATVECGLSSNEVASIRRLLMRGRTKDRPLDDKE